MSDTLWSQTSSVDQPLQWRRAMKSDGSNNRRKNSIMGALQRRGPPWLPARGKRLVSNNGDGPTPLLFPPLYQNQEIGNCLFLQLYPLQAQSAGITYSPGEMRL